MMKKYEKQRPGIYLYRNDYELLCELEPEDRCRVLDGMMEYAQSGELPDFSGSRLATVVWKSIRPHLDHDASRYQKRVSDSEYAVCCREWDRNGLPRLSREEWETSRDITTDNDRYRSLTIVDGRLPNRNTKADTKSYSNTEGKTDRECERKEESHPPTQAEQELNFEAMREAALKKLQEHSTP